MACLMSGDGARYRATWEVVTEPEEEVTEPEEEETEPEEEAIEADEASAVSDAVSAWMSLATAVSPSRQSHHRPACEDNTGPEMKKALSVVG
jgi:hypothetical protein